MASERYPNDDSIDNVFDDLEDDDEDVGIEEGE